MSITAHRLLDNKCWTKVQKRQLLWTAFRR